MAMTPLVHEKMTVAVSCSYARPVPAVGGARPQVHDRSCRPRRRCSRRRRRWRSRKLRTNSSMTGPYPSSTTPCTAMPSRAWYALLTRDSSGGWGWRPGQPLTDPWSRAAMTWRWKTMNTISVGSRIRIDPARQQGDVGGPLPLEGAQRAGDGPLLRVVHEHERDQELVPRPDGHEDAERHDRRPGERHVDLPEQVPRAGAVDAGGLGQLPGHVHEVRPHPEHREGHVQADQRQDDRQPAC